MSDGCNEHYRTLIEEELQPIRANLFAKYNSIGAERFSAGETVESFRAYIAAWEFDRIVGSRIETLIQDEEVLGQEPELARQFQLEHQRFIASFQEVDSIRSALEEGNYERASELLNAAENLRLSDPAKYESFRQTIEPEMLAAKRREEERAASEERLRKEADSWLQDPNYRRIRVTDASGFKPGSVVALLSGSGEGTLCGFAAMRRAIPVGDQWDAYFLILKGRDVPSSFNRSRWSKYELTTTNIAEAKEIQVSFNSTTLGQFPGCVIAFSTSGTDNRLYSVGVLVSSKVENGKLSAAVNMPQGPIPQQVTKVSWILDWPEQEVRW